MHKCPPFSRKNCSVKIKPDIYAFGFSCRNFYHVKSHENCKNQVANHGSNLAKGEFRPGDKKFLTTAP